MVIGGVQSGYPELSDGSRAEHQRERASTFATKLPAWLKVKAGKVRVDKDDAAIVGTVFELAAKGFGQATIAEMLNAEW